MKIAVYMQDDNEIISFMQSDKIEIYQKEEKWTLYKIITLPKPFPTEIAKLRDSIKQLAFEMDDCKIIIGGELMGIPYSVFNQMGFSIVDIPEFSATLFDEILDDMEKGNEQQRLPEEMLKNTEPVETSISGVYYLDLVSLQMEYPSISSKKALQSFLNQTPFLELKLKCNHIPPWLENGCYSIVSEKTMDGKILAGVTKKNCQEDAL